MLSLDGQDLFPLVIGLRGAVATLAAVDSNEPFRGTSPVEQNEAGFRCELVLWLFFGGSVVVFWEFVWFWCFLSFVWGFLCVCLFVFLLVATHILAMGVFGRPARTEDVRSRDVLQRAKQFPLLSPAAPLMQ